MAKIDKTQDDKVKKITDVIKQHMAAKNKIDGLIKQREKVEKDVLQVETELAESWDASQTRDKVYKEYESWKQELERSERRLTSGIAEARSELKRFNEKIGRLGMGDANAVYSPTHPNMGLAVDLLRDTSTCIWNYRLRDSV